MHLLIIIIKLNEITTTFSARVPVNEDLRFKLIFKR